MASAFVPVDLDKLLDEFEEKEQGEFASSVREGETLLWKSSKRSSIFFSSKGIFIGYTKVHNNIVLCSSYNIKF